MRYNEAAEAYGTEEGKLEGGLPGGVIEGLEFTEGRAAGVVDQDIDLSECCGGGFDDMCCLRGFLYIDGDGYYASLAFGAQFFRCFPESIGVTRTDDDIGAFRCERSGAGFSESLAGGEDERRLSG